MTQYRTFSQTTIVHYLLHMVNLRGAVWFISILISIYTYRHIHTPHPYTWLHDWVLTCWQFWSVWSSVGSTFHTLAPFIYSWGINWTAPFIQIDTSTHNHLLLCVLSTPNIIEWIQSGLTYFQNCNWHHKQMYNQIGGRSMRLFLLNLIFALGGKKGKQHWYYTELPVYKVAKSAQMLSFDAALILSPFQLQNNASGTTLKVIGNGDDACNCIPISPAFLAKEEWGRGIPEGLCFCTM